jgi:hypothetical protein
MMKVAHKMGVGGGGGGGLVHLIKTNGGKKP